MPDRPPHHASRLASGIHALQTAANSHGSFPHAPALIHQRSFLHSGQTTAVLSFTSWLPFPMHRPCIVSVISHAIAPMLPCPALAVCFFLSQVFCTRPQAVSITMPWRPSPADHLINPCTCSQPTHCHGQASCIEPLHCTIKLQFAPTRCTNLSAPLMHAHLPPTSAIYSLKVKV